MLYTLTPEQERQAAVNRELSVIAAALVDRLEGRWTELNVLDRFFVWLFNKARRSFDAVALLTANAYVEDALCILRILIENTINFYYAAKTDPVDAARRYCDWAILDAVRRERSQDFQRGTILYSAERERKLLEGESDIKARYSRKDFESLKRGVFGIPLEQRAEVAGLGVFYDRSYRITSRNVHALDVAELDTTQREMGKQEYASFLRVRVDFLLSNARFCLGPLCLWVDANFNCGMREKIQDLQQRDDFPVQF